jgi:hypothetical protein
MLYAHPLGLTPQKQVVLRSIYTPLRIYKEKFGKKKLAGGCLQKVQPGNIFVNFWADSQIFFNCSCFFFG